jgi:hypothetical protein
VIDLRQRRQHVTAIALVQHDRLVFVVGGHQ